ncbi:hypothetical protein PM3016_2315 [Paenibacillus mucilaginosus 3016]|uniref:AB hydrolase-1 domain-containing protein n=2 Tax=Paenibacillus mucilaginosus TaxID=61624 RepID=H6NJC4_9BACL|nr:alpha/beta fold hydrolase [Paenibacillus mucilaginosus]AFC29203.1 hypothetical protein PM3016_2315 [Paenibacillus mucilaginosus 3016]AFH61376.1 hypothetical protein B2K_11700 [Paenibacillus mucilaginosus K02]WFA17936.1 alpha/beta fold hydrolase [Paenibacillus mucilaginosus]
MNKPVILFIHGAFVTASSWGLMRSYFEARGFQTIAPAWPYHEKEAAELRKHPASRLGTLKLEELIAYYTNIIQSLPSKPILIGHSYGGMLTQILMDRDLGSAGIAISPVATRGVIAARYPTTVRSVFGILSKPWKTTYLMPFSTFQYAFVHLLSREEQEQAYHDNVVPETSRIFFQTALSPIDPKSPTAVNYNPANRGPLLLVAGEEDRITTAASIRKNFSLYRPSSRTVTEFKAFPERTHWIIAQEGWEEVAGYAFDWLNDKLDLGLSPHASPAGKDALA